MPRVRYKGAELKRRQRAGELAVRNAMREFHESPFVRGMYQGATFGFGDELGIHDRPSNLAAQEESPLAYLGGEIAGETAALLPMAALAAPTKLAQLIKRAYSSSSPLGKTVAGAGAGGTGGALFGGAAEMGRAEGGLSERAEAAQGGALFGAGIGAPLGAIPGGAQLAKQLREKPFVREEGGAADLSRREFLKGAGAVAGAAGAAAAVPPALKTVAKVAGRAATRPSTIKFGALGAKNPDLGTSMASEVLEMLDDDVIKRTASRAGVGPDDDSYYDVIDELVDQVDLTPDDLVTHAESFIDTAQSFGRGRKSETIANVVDEARMQAKTLLDEAEKLEGANLDEIAELRAQLRGSTTRATKRIGREQEDLIDDAKRYGEDVQAVIRQLESQGYDVSAYR